MSVVLSPDELERVMADLREALPGRHILQASPSPPSCHCGRGGPSIGKYKYNGEPITLEKDIEVFYSIHE